MYQGSSIAYQTQWVKSSKPIAHSLGLWGSEAPGLLGGRYSYQSSSSSEMELSPNERCNHTFHNYGVSYNPPHDIKFSISIIMSFVIVNMWRGLNTSMYEDAFWQLQTSKHFTTPPFISRTLVPCSTHTTHTTLPHTHIYIYTSSPAGQAAFMATVLQYCTGSTVYIAVLF